MIRIFISVVLLLQFAFGDNVKINQLINDIKNTPASERYKKINQLKILLRNQNQATRSQTIKKLQLKQHTTTSSKQYKYVQKQRHYSKSNSITSSSNQKQQHKGKR